ncbi:hypothetical protein BP5796_10240 [Coleophoma crateriformis]|uniref:ABM domain-containing protein n=1 Tax=Coleophoma crateriformis TaxID=565419 RepID=A0A3D8QV24_9HELO|nr:hypothetical protein BP5796_10240 [Coleophoma crateriformis]
MSSLYVIGHLKTNGGAARDKVLAALTTVAEYSQAHEPGVLKFCVALPRADEGDETSVFAIEDAAHKRYADQSALDTHMGSKPVKALVQTFESDSTLFSAPPAIYGLASALRPAASFTRAGINSQADPLLIFANFAYQAGGTARAMPGWEALVGRARADEPGTLSYTVLRDSESEWVRTVEAYVSREFLDGVHVKSEAVAANQRQNGEWRTGEKEVFRLRMLAGYLYKEEEGQRS